MSMNNSLNHAEGHSSRDDHGLSCQVCAKRFKYMSVLERHQRTHDKQNNILCKYCDVTFARKVDLMSHVKTQHKQSRHLEENEHKCQLCPETRKEAYKLAQHIEKAHSGSSEKNHKCKQCSCAFSSQDSLYRHTKLWHVDAEDENEEVGTEDSRSAKAACSLCSKRFSSSSNLRKHVRNVHAKERCFPCPSCSQQFCQRDRLDAHFRLAHRGQPFACVHCTCSYPSLQGLRRHESLVHKGLDKAVYRSANGKITGSVTQERLSRITSSDTSGPLLKQLRKKVLEKLETVKKTNSANTSCGATTENESDLNSSSSPYNHGECDSSDQMEQGTILPSTSQQSLADMRRAVLQQLAVERGANTDCDQTAAESEKTLAESEPGDDDSDTSMFDDNEDVLVYKASNPALLITGGSLVDKKPKGVATITTAQHQPTPELVLQRSVDETDDRKRSATFQFPTASSSVSVISESMVNSCSSSVLDIDDDQTANDIDSDNRLDISDTDRDLVELHNTLPTVQRSLPPLSGASGSEIVLCQQNSEDVKFSMCKRSRFVFKQTLLNFSRQ